MVLISKSYFIFKKYSFKRLLWSLFLLCEISSSNLDSQLISRIDIIGNKITKLKVIEREIEVSIGSKIDTIAINEDINRLKNLGLFQNIEWSIYQDNNSTILRYILLEGINKIPPILLPVYSETTGWSFKGGIFYNNFQGMNRRVSTNITLGGLRSYNFGVYDPWVYGNHISIGFSSSYDNYKHLFLDNTSVLSKYFKINFGSWSNKNIKYKIGFGSLTKEFKSELDLQYNYLLSDFNFIFDTRDIYWNPASGTNFKNYFEVKYDNNNNKKSFYVIGQSLSTYKQILVEWVFATNISFSYWSGYKNNVWLSYFGGPNKVRGFIKPTNANKLFYKNRDLFGFNYIHGTIELRRTIPWKFSPMYNSLVFVAFLDGGFISDNWGSLISENMIKSFGLGLRIPFPLINSVRLDLGFGLDSDSKMNPVLHFGLDQKF